MKKKIINLLMALMVIIEIFSMDTANIQAKTFDLNDSKDFNINKLQNSYHSQKSNLVSHNNQKDEVNSDKKEFGTVIIRYVNFDDGKEIERKVLTGEVGKPYFSEQKSYRNLYFKDVTGNVNGNYTKDDIEVIYSYTANPKLAADNKDKDKDDDDQSTATKGQVKVRFVDQDGEEIKTSVTLTGKIGDIYGIDPNDYPIEDCEYVGVDGNLFGNYEESPQTVTLKYKRKDSVGKLTIRYIDKDSQNSIAADKILTGKIGESFTIEKINIPGYIYDHVEGQVNGTYDKQPQTITFMYKKDQQVTGKDVVVHYLDVKTHEVIANSIVLRGNIGDQYNAERLKISGYTFDHSEGNENGVFSNSKQNVTLYYAPADSKAVNKDSQNKNNDANDDSNNKDMTGDSNNQNRSNNGSTQESIADPTALPTNNSSGSNNSGGTSNGTSSGSGNTGGASDNSSGSATLPKTSEALESNYITALLVGLILVITPLLKLLKFRNKLID